MKSGFVLKWVGLSQWMMELEEVESPYLLDVPSTPPPLLPQLDAQNIMFSSQTVFCWMAERLVKCIASQIMLHIPPIWRNPAHKSHINFPRKRKSGSAEKLISSLERQSGEGEWKTRANELRRGLGCCTYWVTPLFSPTFLSWQHKRIWSFLDKISVNPDISHLEWGFSKVLHAGNVQSISIWSSAFAAGYKRERFNSSLFEKWVEWKTKRTREERDTRKTGDPREGWIDKAPRLSIRIDIWILLYDTVFVKLNQIIYN